MIVLFGVLLSACNTQKLQHTFTIEPVSTLRPTAINTPVLKNTPVATVTFTPLTTDMPKLTGSTILPTATATVVPTLVETEPTIGSTRMSEVCRMVQMYVPSGEFIMGSDDDEAKRTIEGGRAYPEIPVNMVYLDDYWFDKYEVSNGQYALCVDAGVCLSPLSVQFRNSSRILW